MLATIEFDNYGACMSVSEELLCAFELLKVIFLSNSVCSLLVFMFCSQPLDGAALRKEMTKAKRKR